MISCTKSASEPVSTPRGRLTSPKVTSIDQRRMNQPSMSAGSVSVSVASRAWGLRRLAGSRTSSQRNGTTGLPGWLQTAHPVASSTWRSPVPYQSGTVCSRHLVAGSVSRCSRVGSRPPVRGGLPTERGERRGAGANRRASSRRRVTTQTRERTASSRSMAAKPLSATATMRRSGSQRATCRSIWRAPSISVLWRTPCVCDHRSEGTSCVRNGNAHTRCAQGIRTSSITESHRSPLAFEVAVARSHRITVDPARGDPGTPATNDRIVQFKSPPGRMERRPRSTGRAAALPPPAATSGSG